VNTPGVALPDGFFSGSLTEAQMQCVTNCQNAQQQAQANNQAFGARPARCVRVKRARVGGGAGDPSRSCPFCLRCLRARTHAWIDWASADASFFVDRLGYLSESMRRVSVQQRARGGGGRDGMHDQRTLFGAFRR
jgi:hypothetical protein